MSGSRHPRARVRLVAWALTAHLAVAPLHAAPASSDVEGYVVSIEADDIIVDIGSSQGIAVGDVVELWHPLELVHPVTRQRIRDRYRVGSLKVVQIRDRVAIATVERSKRPPEPGDTVVLRRRLPEPGVVPTSPAGGAVVAAAPSGASAAPSPALAVEAAKVSALFDGLREASLVDRIRAYVDYVRKNPQSPFARVLHEDAIHYHRLFRAQREAGAEAPVAVPPLAPKAGAVGFEAPSTALAGRDLDVGIYLSPPYQGAVLHVRRPKDVGYRSIKMEDAGGGHHRATLQGALMVSPRVEYFIEAVDADGHPRAVAGSDDVPYAIEVEATPTDEPPTLQKRTTASVLTDWADYNRFRGNDRAWQTEGFLGMRFMDVGVRALRTGFGVYRGVGGSLDELDEQSLEPRKVGLTYGYLEGEFGFRPGAAIIARAVCGLTEEGIAGGALALVRIGSDLETNLSLGGEVLGGVGVRSITQLELRELPRVPITLRGEVTNQPAGAVARRLQGHSLERGELGVRTIVQVGYELSPGFVVAIRGSYQGRTIYHAGPGLGGAVSYSW